MAVQTEFSKKQDLLIQASFTNEFLEGEINLQDKFNELEVDVQRTDVYANGTILTIAVDLSEKNKDVLKSIVKDFNAYNELVDLGFNSEKKENQTDLCSILDYSESKLKVTVLYQWDHQVFEFEK